MEVKLQETHEIHSDESLLLQPRQIVIKIWEKSAGKISRCFRIRDEWREALMIDEAIVNLWSPVQLICQITAMWSMAKAEPDESRVWTSSTEYNYQPWSATGSLFWLFCFLFGPFILLSFCPFFPGTFLSVSLYLQSGKNGQLSTAISSMTLKETNAEAT